MQEKRPQKKGAVTWTAPFYKTVNKEQKTFLRTRYKTTIDAHFGAKRFALNIV